METITEQQPRLTGPEIEEQFRYAIEMRLWVLYDNENSYDAETRPRLRMWRDQVEGNLLREVLDDLDAGRITDIGFNPKGFEGFVYQYGDLDPYGYDFKCHDLPSRAERARAKAGVTGHNCEANAVRRPVKDECYVMEVCDVCGDIVDWAPVGDTTTQELKEADQPF